MKTIRQNIRKAFLIVNLFFISTVCIAQANEGFTYQAVIRNSSGALVTNASVGIRISLLESSTTGTVLFSERHTITTNANGLVTFVITDGILISGSFSAINWGNVAVFLKTDTDPTGGTNYTITTTSQLKSVPFANYANEAGNTWKPSGNFVGSSDFIGSTNNADVVFRRNNAKAGLLGITNTAFGNSSLPNNTSVSNSAFGSFSLGQNTAGFGNVGIGYEALRVNNGNYNTSIGHSSLTLATGDQNTALGWRALDLLTAGGGNIAIGRITNVPSPTANNQLSIGNVIYGTAMGDTANGKIGIGVPVPTEKLEVDGKTKTTNLQVTAGAGLNRVLTSDASGNATWQNSNANTAMYAKQIGFNQVIPSGTFVKIFFLNEIWDDASVFNSGTSEWTIPSNGFYHIKASVLFAILSASTLVELAIQVNNAPVFIRRQKISANENIDISLDFKLVANDIVTIRILQGSDMAALLSGNQQYNYFSGYKIY